MNKMSESGFAGWKDEQDLKENMKKKNINTYNSGNKNPENPLIRVILIMTIKAAIANTVKSLRTE